MKKTLTKGFFLVLIFGLGFFVVLKYLVHTRTEREISKMINEISYVESLRYESLKVGLWGNRLDFSNVSLKIQGVPETIHAGDIRLFDLETANGYLLSLHVEIRGVGIPLKKNLSDGSCNALDILKKEKRVFDIDCFYQYDPDHRLLTLKNIKLIEPELAQLEASIMLSNVDPSIMLLNNLAGSLPHVLGVSVSQASVVYTDHSLAEKISLCRSHLPESEPPGTFEVISANVNQMLRNEKDDNTRAVLENALKFFNRPETLRVSISPEKPVPLGRFLWVRHFKEVVELLNVKIET